jgi:hypothetical protein
MALLTCGTAAVGSLRALAWSTNMNTADLAALNALCTYEQSSASGGAAPYMPQPVFDRGLIYYPMRGALRIFPGDYIVADPVSGFYQIINAAGFTGGSYVHS